MWPDTIIRPQVFQKIAPFENFSNENLNIDELRWSVIEATLKSRAFQVPDAALAGLGGGAHSRHSLTLTLSLTYLSDFPALHENAMSNLENPNNVIVDEYLESSLDSVDSSEERAKVAAEQVGLPEDDAYQVGYAVREAMVNAIVHGNRYSANKRVHFVLSRTQSSIQVLIEDEGTGFLPEQQADPLAEENLLSQSGRGIMIIRSFVDEFVIERSEQGGTRVVLRKSIPPGT